MISKFKINYVSNAQISTDEHDKIIMIKNQYWQYSKESHERWRKENLNNEDGHLWLENDNGEIIAYLNFVFLQIRFETKTEDVIGIGNVCVDKESLGRGIGLLLMQICNYYILNYRKRSVLLCQKKLSKFYQKSGWIEYPGKVILNGSVFDGLAMFNRLPEDPSIIIERNF